MTSATQVIVALSLLGMLAGCGKVPRWVDPPVGVERSAFPRVYPDPALDPTNRAPGVSTSPHAPAQEPAS